MSLLPEPDDEDDWEEEVLDPPDDDSVFFNISLTSIFGWSIKSWTISACFFSTAINNALLSFEVLLDLEPFELGFWEFDVYELEFDELFTFLFTSIFFMCQ